MAIDQREVSVFSKVRSSDTDRACGTRATGSDSDAIHFTLSSPEHGARPLPAAADPTENFWIGPSGSARAKVAPIILGPAGAPGARCPADNFNQFQALVERVTQPDVDFTRGLFDIACHLAAIGDCPTVIWEMRVANLCLSRRCRLSIAVILSVMMAQALRNTRLHCAPQISVTMLDHVGEMRLIVRDNGLNCYNDYAPSIQVIESLLHDLGAQVSVGSGQDGANEVTIDFLLTDKFRG